MTINTKKTISHSIALLGFLIISLVYFYPVLKGKKIFQSDIAQYIGMAKQQMEYRESEGEEIYWNDRAFAGMPTYQLGAKYPHNYIKKLDLLIRFLPRPADYLFLYFIGFYILLCTLKIDSLKAFFGSLVFGFSTYLIIIIGVGHNAKAHALGYMPIVVSGCLLVFHSKLRHKLLKGGLLFCIALALQLVANHYQMTYYTLLLILVIGITYLIKAIRSQQLVSLGKSVIVLFAGVILAAALNATSILATQEYSKFSTRGSSELTINEEGAPKVSKKGLNKDYILQYSYGFLETFNLLVPRFLGGSSNEDAGKDAAIVKELTKLGYPYKDAKEFAKHAPTYWGNQPIVGAPAYLGAGIIFLFVLGLFLLKGYKKWWVITASALALLLSYGKNLEWFSDIFINYFPLYNKFRAVTSIQVIIEFCVPLFGMVALAEFFKQKYSAKEKTKALYQATGVVGGLLFIFMLFHQSLFSFVGPSDSQFLESAGYGFVSALREDRANMLFSDSLRSFCFVIAIALLLFLFLQKKITSKEVTITAIGILLIADLVPVAWRYVNSSDFVSAKQMTSPFQASKIDQEILKDTTRYRVYDLSQGNPLNTARTSFFHNSVGGYHGAKPKRIQELFDFHLAKGNESVLNMLNVKYYIFNGENGLELQQNENAFGNAWLVKNTVVAENPDEEITLLDTTDLRKTAVIPNHAPVTANTFTLDSLSQIVLKSAHPEKLVYAYKNSHDGFAVFSEMYYEKGWKAYLDNKEIPIIKTNYALRGLQLPAGKHEITFKFTPAVVKTGSTISLIATIILLIFITSYLFYERKIRAKQI